MTITSLHITDFRNLSDVDIAPSSQSLNIIYGNNGSGKTSLLEAIHYLGSGRSFRTSTASRLIRHSQDKFSIFAQTMNCSKLQVPIGIEREIGGSVRLRINDRDITSTSEVAYLLPIRVINSHSHSLFESGPTFRRKYLDWGLFYQSGNFLHCWKNFERVLKQRNTILRDKRSKKELDIWTDEIIKYGLELDQLRQNYVQTLTPILLEVVKDLLSLSTLEIRYQSGWDNKQHYAAVLANSYQEELRVGYTQFGPHRADVELVVDTISVKHFLSRGQQKLLICAMIVAQGMLLAKCANKSLIYLVDDLPSELDSQSKRRLISLLSQQKSQIFITAIASETIEDSMSSQSKMKLFHVEHGNVVEDDL